LSEGAGAGAVTGRATERSHARITSGTDEALRVVMQGLDQRPDFPDPSSLRRT